jgi:hypothetical protein
MPPKRTCWMKCSTSWHSTKFFFYLIFVIAGLVPAIHEHPCNTAIMDGRDKPGHDGGCVRINLRKRNYRFNSITSKVDSWTG